MNLDEKNKKFLSIILVVILISAGISVAITYGLKALGEKEDLSVKIIPDASIGAFPFTVSFSSVVTNYRGDLKYEWDFGDGRTSNEKEPTITYEEEGEYACSLKVTDQSGKTQLDTLAIIVERNRPPIVTLTINHNTLERIDRPVLSRLPIWPGDKQKIINPIYERDPYAWGEGRIVVDAQIFDIEDDKIVSYDWTHTVETQLSQFFAAESPVYYYKGNKSIQLPEITTWSRGRHVVELTVEDSAGNKQNATIEFLVEDSREEITRQTRWRTGFSLLNLWINYGNPFLGAFFGLLLLSLWKYSNFTFIKLCIALILQFLLQVPMDNVLLTQAEYFFEEKPMIGNMVDWTLTRLQNLIKILGERIERITEDFVNDKVDSIDILRENLGFSNKRPIISNPFPEEGSVNLPVDYSNVYIDVNDAEGDPFNITISGDYVNDITYINQYNGTFNATLITPLPEREYIYWNVTVVDHNGKIVQGEYKFRTL